jgi:hypothetical protein
MASKVFIFLLGCIDMETVEKLNGGHFRGY